MQCSCGRLRPRRHESAVADGFAQAGWYASCLPWLREREVALIGADTPQDVQPSGYGDVLMPVHAVGLVAMACGCSTTATWKACAATAAELSQWGLPARGRTGPLRRHFRQPGQPDRHVLTRRA
jgi:hypothetical protein